MQRRLFLSGFSAASLAGLAAGPVRAISLEPAPAHLRLGVPPVPGALDWDLLAEAGQMRFVDDMVSRFPAALRALDGTPALLAGYMMPLAAGDAHRHFLVSGAQFHCGTCLAGDLRRLVAVQAAEPVAHSDAPVLLRGTLRLLDDESSPLFYRLDDARPA